MTDTSGLTFLDIDKILRELYHTEDQSYKTHPEKWNLRRSRMRLRDRRKLHKTNPGRLMPGLGRILTAPHPFLKVVQA